MWCQIDWEVMGRRCATSTVGSGQVLFVAWVAWSRFRVVIPCWDQTSESLATCLDSMFRLVGGVTDYVLTDNAKTVTRATHCRGAGAAPADGRHRTPLRARRCTRACRTT
ncbi:MAG: DDE-type integrase/transposase/recombinase [Micropruina sp.]|nr:DDE-type integrase/transposase/recombinase [Micropruina sp.]